MQVGIGVKFKNSPTEPEPFERVYEEWIEYARVADELGFDYIVVPEHHSVRIGYDPTPFVTLAALARETKRIRLATQPLLLPLYHPVHVAEQLAVLDVLSGGRAMLGVGVGYRDGDFAAFGVPKRERGARTEEALTILLGALCERGYSYSGRFWQVEGVDITPRPLQQPHPKVYYTARSGRAVDRAVRFRLGVNTLHHEAMAGGIYADYCAKATAAGIDGSALDFTIVRNGYIAADMETALSVGGRYVTGRNAYMSSGEYSGRDPSVTRQRQEIVGPDGRPIVLEGDLLGTAETWIETFERDREELRGPVPFTAWTLGLRPEGMPLADGLRALEEFAKRVLPWAHAQAPR